MEVLDDVCGLLDVLISCEELNETSGPREVVPDKALGLFDGVDLDGPVEDLLLVELRLEVEHAHKSNNLNEGLAIPLEEKLSDVFKESAHWRRLTQGRLFHRRSCQERRARQLVLIYKYTSEPVLQIN